MTLYLYQSDDKEIKLFSDYASYVVINDVLFICVGKTTVNLEK